MELKKETSDHREKEYAAATALLAKPLGLREPIRPPRHLVREIVRDQTDRAAALAGFVSVHWDMAVDTLNSQGYAAILMLSSELDNRLAHLREFLEAQEEEQALVQGPDAYMRLRRIVAADANRYGEAKTLKSSFASETLPSGLWSWSLDRRDSGDFYVLFVPPPQKPLDLELDLPVSERTFRAQMTWGSALALVTSRLSDRSGPTFELKTFHDLWETVRFRRDIVGRVIEDFEVFGSVSHISQAGWIESVTKNSIHAARLGNTDYFLNCMADKFLGSDSTLRQIVREIVKEVEDEIEYLELPFGLDIKDEKNTWVKFNKSIEYNLRVRQVNLESLRALGSKAFSNRSAGLPNI